MSVLIMSLGGGSGNNSDDCTALKGDVLKGKTTITNDSDDEIVTGTLELTGNAASSDVLSGKTFYNTDAKTKQTGNIAVRSDNPTSARLLAEESKIKMVPPKGYYDGSNHFTWDTQALVAERGGLNSSKLLAGQSAFGISGTATNDATAGDGDVLSGKTYWKSGAKRTGSMANQGAKTSSLNCGGSYTIPAGYHNGAGKVTANSLASQTSATAAAGNIVSGKTAYVNGSKITGSLTVQSAISFSAAALSYNTIRINWTNPSKGPWQGIFIQMSTTGSPGTSGGSRVYTGSGINPNQAGGSNHVDISGLAANTQYYFTCSSYCDTLGWGSLYNVTSKTMTINLSSIFADCNVCYYPGVEWDSGEDGEEGWYNTNFHKYGTPIFTADTISIRAGSSGMDHNFSMSSNNNIFIRIRNGRYISSSSISTEIPDSVITDLRNSYKRAKITYTPRIINGHNGVVTTIDVNILTIEKLNYTNLGFQRGGWFVNFVFDFKFYGYVVKSQYGSGSYRSYFDGIYMTIQLLP